MASNLQSAGGGGASDGAPQSGQLTAIGGDEEVRGTPAHLPLRNGALTLRELVDLYFSYYSGRDGALLQRLSWWTKRLGSIGLEDLGDDEVHAALEQLSNQQSAYYAGTDVLGRPIFKSKRRPIAPATVNRYLAALGAVITWAIKKRIAPKGYVHPCRTVERRSENNERVRFLSDHERARLLGACAESKWRLLHLLVLLALTTGARKGELLALRWADIDFDRCLAHCGTTKNGDPKALPLVPEVMTLLAEYRGPGASLIFGSPRRPSKPFEFKAYWHRALVLAKVRDFRFHDLRHSCASMLAQSGATLLEIADVLGHRQLQMTKRYSHLTTGHKAELVNRVWRTVHAKT